MRKKYSIKLGKGQVILKKSDNLVGLKPKKEKDLTKTRFANDENIPNLGGFQVVSLENSNGDLDTELDKVRQKRDIAVGTHVFIAEGDDRPLVPTGEIYIIFETITDEEEQLLVLDEFHLELIERRGSDRIIAAVTKESSNPIKVAEALEKSSLVKHAEPDLDTYLDEYLKVPKDNLLANQWYLRNQGKVTDAKRPKRSKGRAWAVKSL